MAERRVLIPLGLAPPVRRREARVAVTGGRTMGTTWCVKLAANPETPPLDRLRESVQAVLDRVVAQMSTWEPASDLCRFNRAPAGTWHPLLPEFFAVLDCALAAARDSGGAYDPTIAPLVDLWGFGPAPGRDTPPPTEAVAEALAATGWRRLALDRPTRHALQPGGIRLDLSAVAKGYGVDLAAGQLEAAGVRDYLVEVGGELRGAGTKPDGSPWWVALERPTEPGRTPPPETRIALHGLSIATSGDYRRCFVSGGRRYAHTIDPRTGHPAAGDLASVTVLHPSCMHADALATALFVLGEDAGGAHARRRAIPAVFVSRVPGGYAERLTPALAAMLE
ncbi:MAG: FAD:protein FMN transferase [Alphaproteobacteria bacterium]|nr:FAD:protein FMN transferase [Alphaproteobacteria bacterium]